MAFHMCRGSGSILFLDRDNRQVGPCMSVFMVKRGGGAKCVTGTLVSSFRTSCVKLLGLAFLFINQSAV